MKKKRNPTGIGISSNYTTPSSDSGYTAVSIKNLLNTKNTIKIIKNEVYSSDELQESVISRDNIVGVFVEYLNNLAKHEKTSKLIQYQHQEEPDNEIRDAYDLAAEVLTMIDFKYQYCPRSIILPVFKICDSIFALK